MTRALFRFAKESLMHRLLHLQRMALAWAGAALAVLAAGCGSMTPAASGVQRLYVLYLSLIHI